MIVLGILSVYFPQSLFRSNITHNAAGAEAIRELSFSAELICTLCITGIGSTTNSTSAMMYTPAVVRKSALVVGNLSRRIAGSRALKTGA